LQAGFLKPSRIVDREDDYRKRRLNRLISPARNDAMAMVRARSANCFVRPLGHFLCMHFEVYVSVVAYFIKPTYLLVRFSAEVFAVGLIA
jgi:hypothetical protein